MMLKGKGAASAFVISASESLLLLLLLDHVDLQRVGRAWLVALRAKHREQLMGKKQICARGSRFEPQSDQSR